ncbi:MAG TPA: pseudouridine synthase [Clostridia bacterium]|nr:pseudouridine synthase [Clostridia bacterium]
MALERLQKILAAAGVASRRKAEELITAGRITVNGTTVTELGSKADPDSDHIRVDDKPLKDAERPVYILLNKPKGYVTTVTDPEGRPTVMEFVRAIPERVFPVGRLDFLSEGLLLLTNDGDLMQRLTKASSHVPKTYMVKVSGEPKEEDIDKLRAGIVLPPEPSRAGTFGGTLPGMKRRSETVKTQPARIELAKAQENPWYEVTLLEGRNRQIRRMFEQIGHHVEKIKRVRYGTLELDVEPGEFRILSPVEVVRLKSSIGKPVSLAPSRPRRSEPRNAESRAPETRVPEQGRTEAPRGPARERPGRREGRPSSRGPQRGRPARTEREPRESGIRHFDSEGKVQPEVPTERPRRTERPTGRNDRERRPSTGGFKSAGFKSGGFKSGGFKSKPGGFGFRESRGPNMAGSVDRPNRPSAGFGERPSRPRSTSFNDRPDRPKTGGFGDRPSRGPKPGGFKSSGFGGGNRRPDDRRSKTGSFGDRPSRGPKPEGFAARPSRGPGGFKSGGFGDRESSGPRAGGIGDRPGRPSTKSKSGGFGARPSRDPAEGGFGGENRGPKPGGFGGRPKTGSFGRRPKTGSFGRAKSGGFGGRTKTGAEGGESREPRTGGFGGRSTTGGFGSKRKTGGFGGRPKSGEFGSSKSRSPKPGGRPGGFGGSKKKFPKRDR